MKFFGLHWVDVTILLGYIVAVLLIGKALSRGVKGEGDFFLGGRSLGRWLQFFLSFGNMTDPGQATTTSSSVYRQGAGGAWLALITLFLTPYYWFMNVWFRRVRLTTMADLFADRFGSRFLATLYAVTMLIIAVIGVIAAGNVTALKTLQPLMVKEEAVWTLEERQRVADYHEYARLKQQRQAGALPAEAAARYDTLSDYYKRGELQPYVTYLKPVTFYLVSTGIVAVFIMLGGLKASAVVDAIQAMLVVLIATVALVNTGLSLLPEVGDAPITLQRILGYLFAPLAWAAGLPWPEAQAGGSLLGTKTVLNEFVAYVELSKMDEALSPRSRVLMTYALCGFANFGSLGILIGGMGAMVPERRREIVGLGMKSIVAGTFATCLAAAIAGLFL